MIEPTGYTALDLIGYTDRGAFAANANYVKNDLVHYGGNIWRVLIDDTIGVTPSEGVNYTLFIGEPTNLVERIIAPLEENPATIAYTTGRQIIYNDYLYEVIDDIAVGDALVAYEDDPTNANIKLAPAVETQVLAIKSDLADAVDDISNKADKTQISNPNLLDNPWFTVNQRGMASYTGNIYSVDRWRSVSSNSVITVNSDGSVTLSKVSTGNAYLVQYLEDSLVEKLGGRTVTLSINVKAVTGRLIGIRIRYGDSSDTYIGALSRSTLPTGISFNTGVIPDTTKKIRLEIFDATTTESAASITVESVKLELGSVSTLAMDTAPNYAEELAKCQRYFWRKEIGSGENFGFGQALNATQARISIILPVVMRAAPTLTIDNVSGLIAHDNTTSNITSITFGAMRSGDNILALVCDTTGLTQNGLCLGRAGSQIMHLDFSADL